MTTASAILTDYSQYIAMGFSMSVILSFTLWAIMKLWRFVVDILSYQHLTGDDKYNFRRFPV